MLIAAGDRYDRLVSWGAVTTSNDGTTWTIPTEPFATRAKVVGVTHGPDKIVAVSDAGLVSTAPPDVGSWHSGAVWENNFAPLGVQYATDLTGSRGIYMMCGQGKFAVAQGDYAPLDEAGLIFASSTGENWDWRMIYAHDAVNSRFYNIRRITNTRVDVWIAVGSAMGRPIAVYSFDNGETWAVLNFPALSTLRYAYDVVWYDSKFWFTANGMILDTASLSAPAWDASPEIKPQYGSADLIKIAVNPAGHMVAACSGGLAYSVDRVGWTVFSAPGYRFRSIVWHQDQWIAGAESNMTQYTYWRSTNTTNWTPDNNMVQAYDFVIV
jgi:hypothetical protein